MEINTNFGLGGLSDRVSSRRPTTVATEADNVSFPKSTALESGLASVAETRPEAVARARHLVADASYPPQAVINKISILLAMQLASARE